MRSILRHCGSEQQQPSCLVARPHWAATQFISSPMFPLAWGRVAHSYFVAGERADLGRWPRSWGSLRCTAHRHRTRGTPLRRGTGQSERLMTQATLPLHARISGWRHFQFSFRATHFATQVLNSGSTCRERECTNVPHADGHMESQRASIANGSMPNSQRPVSNQRRRKVI